MSRPTNDNAIPLQAGERRAVTSIALVGMFRMFGLFALMPVLSIHAAGLDGATPLLIGLAVGAYGLTQAVLQIPLGALSDRLGRIPVILAGLAVFAAGSLLAAFSDSVHGVILGRLLQGAGAISSTLTALIADVTRPEVRTRGMGIYGIGVGSSILLAFVVGPLIAASSGVPGLFVLAALLAGVSAILALAVPRRQRRPSTGPRPQFREALTLPLLRLDLYVFLQHAMLTAVFVALPFVLRNRLDIGLEDHWQLYVGALALSLVGTLPLILADDRGAGRRTLQIALLLQFAGLALLALLGTALLPVLLAMALYFAGLNFIEAALPARLTLLAHEDRRGASLGVFSSAQFLGAFCGGLAGGWLLSGSNPGDVFLVAAGVVFGWLLLHQFVCGATFRGDRPEI